VLSDVARLKSPQWGLVESLDDYPLMSALVSRFGESVLNNGGNGDQAALIYGLGLAKSGQLDHAIRFLSSNPALESWGPSGLASSESERTSLYSLVSQMLNRARLRSLAGLYLALGRRLGKPDEVAKRLDDWISSPKISDSDQRYYVTLKADLDCSMGNTAQAVAEYESCLKAEDPDPQIASTLLTLAETIGDASAVEHVSKATKKVGTDGSRLDFYQAYDRMGLLAKAQETAIKSLEDVNDVNLDAEGQGRLLNAYPGKGVELAALYYKSNQPDQVVQLLRKFPKWGAEDLFPLVTTRRTPNDWNHDNGEPIGFYAAWALAQSGDKETAIRILKVEIPKDVEPDPAYELFNQLDASGSIGFYDELIKANPFQARPLMWKADLLLRMGKLIEAESAVRQAIAFDPTDGSATPERRQTAFSILGRILKAAGKTAEAARCDAVFAAAQVAAQGFREESAGLDSAAANHFAQALTLNSEDAWTLLHYSDTLSRLGKSREALDNYRKALELALTSEGPSGGAELTDRYSSGSTERLALAHSVLERLNKEHPHNAGILCLLGELHASGGDDRAALASYQLAVQAEPTYVRAWESIASLAGEGLLTKDQARQATLALIRLAPGRDSYYYESAVQDSGDFAALWRAYHQAAQTLPPTPPGPLYPLEASRRSLAAGTKPAESPQMQVAHIGPGAALGQIEELRALFP